MTATDPRARARVSSLPVSSSLPPIRPSPPSHLAPLSNLAPVPLAEVAGAVEGAEVRGDVRVQVREASFDSREVTPGSLFFCVPGSRVDGHAFGAQAMAAGAAALVVERWLTDDVPQVRVASAREAMGPMSAVVFGHPAEAIRIVGVTGTNGKTTTTYLLESVFRAAGIVPGIIGTTGARVDGVPVALARTTPEAPDLHRLLASMRDRGVAAVAMEVSSHALDQHRVGGVLHDVAVFTNLSPDHLDHHGTMEGYFAAKLRLFAPSHASRAAVNVDDEHGRRLLDVSIPITTFAVNREADIHASDVSATALGLSFRVDGREFRSSLRGGFNAWNCLAAFAAARLLEIDDATIGRGLDALAGVPGRTEPVDAGQDFLVMVDYAHTPDSIRGVLRAARSLATGRLLVVFGCGGDRDRTKRPLMGRAATAEADLAVITSDNPRSEEPLEIIADIEPGAKEGGGAYTVEPDRRAAIRLVLREARAGDVVLIAGKGHETTQEFADGSIPFDDREVAREELAEIGPEIGEDA